MANRKYKYRPLRKGRKNEDAVYQFILDHASPVPKGWHVQFYFRNRKDFFTRVQAREYGLHRLSGVNEEWQDVWEKDHELGRLEEKEKHIERLRETWWKRVLLNILGL